MLNKTAIVIIIMSIFLSGCVSGKKLDYDVTDGGHDEIITINFWFPSHGNISDQYFMNLAKEYERVNPNIRINMTILSSNAEDVDKKFNIARLSGNMPDVFIAPKRLIIINGPLEIFHELSGYIEAWDGHNDISEDVYEFGKHEDNIYGLPFYATPNILVYRKDYFEEAGLDSESPPVSWEELMDYAERLTVRDDDGNVTRAGFNIPFLSIRGFSRMFIAQNGASLFDSTSSMPTFTSSETIEAFDFIMALKEKDVSIPYDKSKRNEDPFVNSKSAMGLLLVDQISGMLQNNPELNGKIGYAYPMERKQKAAFNGFKFLCIGADSQYKDEAWGFIEFIMSIEQMQLRTEILNIPPIRESMYEGFINSEGSSLDKQLNSVVIDTINHAVTIENIPWVDLLLDRLDIAYQEMYSGEKSVLEALEDAQNTILKELDITEEEMLNK